VAPESFEDNPHQKAQKDCDARRARKNPISYHGYKDRIETDVKYKIIRGYGVTAAFVHDSKEFMGFFPDRPEGEKERVCVSQSGEVKRSYCRSMVRPGRCRPVGVRIHALLTAETKANALAVFDGVAGQTRAQAQQRSGQQIGDFLLRVPKTIRRQENGDGFEFGHDRRFDGKHCSCYEPKALRITRFRGYVRNPGFG
jgi:hypothetical protein